MWRHRELHVDRIIRKGPKDTDPTFSLSSEIALLPQSLCIGWPAMVLNSRAKFYQRTLTESSHCFFFFFSGFAQDEMITQGDRDSTRQSVP